MLWISLIAIAVLALSFLLGAHVASALGFSALLLLLIFSDRPAWGFFGEIAWNTNSDWILLTLPLFVLMGELLIHAGATKDLYQSLNGWFRKLPGGLVQSNVAVGTVFAAVSGSSVASAATIGAVALPEQRKLGYSRRFSLGSIAAGGVLGALIPPSTVLIIYGIIAHESIGALFIAGILPGLMIAVLFMIVVAIWAKLQPSASPDVPAVPLKQRLKDTRKLVPIVLLILLVMGSLYFGIATPTESAAFGSVGAFVIAALRRKLSIDMLKKTLLATASTTGFVMFLLMAAFSLQFVLGYLGVPRAASQAIGDAGFSTGMLLFTIVIVFLILGCFFDAMAIVVTMVPILVPIVVAAGVDTVWFGILVVVLVEVGLITPPYGMNLFVLHGVQKRLGWKSSLSDIYMGALPFVGALFLAVGLLFLFPEIATWLPSTIR